jgi:hypothetical protein
MGGQALISELNHFDLFLTGATILTETPASPRSVTVRSVSVTARLRGWDMEHRRAAIACHGQDLDHQRSHGFVVERLEERFPEFPVELHVRRCRVQESTDAKAFGTLRAGHRSGFALAHEPRYA